MAVDYSKIQTFRRRSRKLLGYTSRKIPKDNLYLPGGILLTACGLIPTEIRRFCVLCRRFSITDRFREPVIFRFCRLIRESNIRRARVLRRIRNFSTRKISSNSLSKAAVTRLLQPTEFSERSRENMLTKFLYR